MCFRSLAPRGDGRYLGAHEEFSYTVLRTIVQYSPIGEAGLFVGGRIKVDLFGKVLYDELWSA